MSAAKIPLTELWKGIQYLQVPPKGTLGRKNTTYLLRKLLIQ